MLSNEIEIKTSNPQIYESKTILYIMDCINTLIKRDIILGTYCFRSDKDLTIKVTKISSKEYFVEHFDYPTQNSHIKLSNTKNFNKLLVITRLNPEKIFNYINICN